MTKNPQSFTAVPVSDTSKLSHRELELIDALRRLGGSARSSDLAKALDVSEETVRRTIKALSKAGLVQRVHGGAYLTGSQSAPSFFRRFAQHPEEKQLIARTVVDRIRDGMTVFLDVGSTTAFVAEALRERRDLTVVTNSIGVAQVLANHHGNRVHLLGGEMQSDERGTFGFVAEQQLRRFMIDVAVLSADAFSARHGVLYANPAEAQLALVVADCTAQTLVAVAAHKFDETAPHRGPDSKSLTAVITDRPVGRKVQAALADLGVDLVTRRKEGSDD